jgi:hypothetical protein
MIAARTYLTPTVCATLLACAGTGSWKDICGCVSAASVLGHALNPGAPIHATESIALPNISKSLAVLLRANEGPIALDAVRRLGDPFTDGCRDEPGRVVCEFWLWSADSQQRGISVVIPAVDSSTLTADTIVASYAYRPIS